MRIAMVTFSTSRSHINHICEEIERNVYGAKTIKKLFIKRLSEALLREEMK